VIPRTLTLVVISDAPDDDIRATIDAIAATVDGAAVPFQVLLVANGFAFDPALADALPLMATVISSAARMPPGALLNGVLPHAKGDVVTFLPAGYRPERWWTAGVFELLGGAHIGAVVPRIVDASGERIACTGVISEDGVLAPRLAGLGRDTIPALQPLSLFFALLGGISVRRDVFDEAGPFDEGYERTLFDLDWTLRARLKARALMYRADVTMRADRPIELGPHRHSRADAQRFLARWQPTVGTALVPERFVP
jgi:hypothetical protein